MTDKGGTEHIIRPYISFSQSTYRLKNIVKYDTCR